MSLPAFQYSAAELDAQEKDGRPEGAEAINKHRGDVFRLFALVSLEMRIKTPQRVRENSARFLDSLDGARDLAPFGLKGMQKIAGISAGVA